MDEKEWNYFTLIELLIAISIIAILAGMLLPALNAAREKAYSIKCASNQKQIGTAFSLYIDDYKGYYPCWGTRIAQDAYIIGGSWDKGLCLLKYAAAKVFVDDSLRNATKPQLAIDATENNTLLPTAWNGYGYNGRGIGRNQIFNTDVNLSETFRPAQLKEIRKPSIVYIVMDTRSSSEQCGINAVYSCYTTNVDTGQADAYRHNKVVNILKADSSVSQTPVSSRANPYLTLKEGRTGNSAPKYIQWTGGRTRHPNECE